MTAKEGAGLIGLDAKLQKAEDDLRHARNEASKNGLANVEITHQQSLELAELLSESRGVVMGVIEAHEDY